MQQSFAKLFQSSHLGVVIATPERILDANPAFLRMAGYTDSELRRGLIAWRQLTPPQLSARDDMALEQLREFGVAVPYEKSYSLRDGSQVDFVTGAVRLSEEPFTFAAYTVNMSETNRLRSIKHELETRQKVIHQLAHELNNPLAALTFLLHILTTSETVAPLDRELLDEAERQLRRISVKVREVLAQSRENPPTDGESEVSEPLKNLSRHRNPRESPDRKMNVESRPLHRKLG